MPATFELKRSTAIQDAADKLGSDKVNELADGFYEFDTNDPYDCRSLFESGIEVVLSAVHKFIENPHRSVWVVDVGCYTDNDGGAYFVGTEEEVLALLAFTE